MKLYRIEREKYLKTTLSGMGASKSEGFRWNSEDTRLVYTAETRALAILEVAVHLDLSEDLPNDKYFIEIEIPDDISALEVELADLPENWDSKPPSVVTQIIGDDFVQNNEAAILKMPSSVVPMEYNYLINPLHPDAKKIRIINKTPMWFDGRLRI